MGQAASSAAAAGAERTQCYRRNWAPTTAAAAATAIEMSKAMELWVDCHANIHGLVGKAFRHMRAHWFLFILISFLMCLSSLGLALIRLHPVLIRWLAGLTPAEAESEAVAASCARGRFDDDTTQAHWLYQLPQPRRRQLRLCADDDDLPWWWWWWGWYTWW